MSATNRVDGTPGRRPWSSTTGSRRRRLPNGGSGPRGRQRRDRTVDAAAPSTSCVGTSHGSGDCCKRAPTSTPTPDATNALFAARVEQHIADYDHHRVEYARRVVGGT
jgi:hypothetical protein